MHLKNPHKENKMNFIRRSLRRAAHGDTTEHSISQAAFTLFATIALGLASPILACLVLLAVAFIRGVGANV